MTGTNRSLHRRTLLVGFAGLAGTAILAACGNSPGDGSGSGNPQDAAKSGFQTWAKNVKVAYRNDSYAIATQQEAFATVVVTAEFQDNATAPWIERESSVQVVKQGNQWQQPSDFRFGPTAKARQTAQASSNSTATVVGQQLAATQTFLDASRIATGTAQAIVSQAQATSQAQAAQAQATAKTQSDQITATAGVQATSTTVAVAQETGTAQAQSSATSAAIATRDAPTPTPVPRPGDVLYQADWSKGAAGWTGASWKWVAGMLTNDGTGNDALPASAAAPYDLGQTANYAIEAEIQALDPRKGLTFGLLVRAKTPNDGYRGGVLLIGQAPSIYIEVPNDSSNMLAKGSFSPGTDWHKYRLEAKATKITFSIDGSPVLNAADNRYVSPDRAWLVSYSTQLNVRSFRIIAL
jgi:hypothetical protein